MAVAFFLSRVTRDSGEVKRTTLAVLNPILLLPIFCRKVHDREWIAQDSIEQN